MNFNALKSTEELQSFLEGLQAVVFTLRGKNEQYVAIHFTVK